MTPHFERELEQRRRDRLNPPEWDARARRRQKTGTDARRGRIEQKDPLSRFDLTPDQLAAAYRWRALSRPRSRTEHAGDALADLGRIRSAVLTSCGDGALMDAERVVLDYCTLGERARERRTGGGRVASNVVRALTAVAELLDRDAIAERQE